MVELRRHSSTISVNRLTREHIDSDYYEKLHTFFKNGSILKCRNALDFIITLLTQSFL